MYAEFVYKLLSMKRMEMKREAKWRIKINIDKSKNLNKKNYANNTPKQQNRCNYGNWPNCLNVDASIDTNVAGTSEANTK